MVGASVLIAQAQKLEHVGKSKPYQEQGRYHAELSSELSSIHAARSPASPVQISADIPIAYRPQISAPARSRLRQTDLQTYTRKTTRCQRPHASSTRGRTSP